MPAITARCISTLCTNGIAYANFLNPPPISSKSNQIPENQAERFVSKAPQIPPTCLSLNILPQSSHIPIYKSAMGIINKIDNTMLMLISSPKITANIYVAIPSAKATGISGTV